MHEATHRLSLIERQTQMYQALHDLSKGINETTTTNELYAMTVGFAMENLHFEKVLIFEHDDYNGWFKIVKHGGYSNPVEQKILKVINLLLSGEVIEYLRVHGEPIIHTQTHPKKEVETLVKSLFMREAYFELFGGDSDIPFGLLVVGNGLEGAEAIVDMERDPITMLGLANFTVHLSHTVNNTIFYEALKREKERLQENVAIRTQQLNEQKKSFEAIYNTSKDGIALLDLETTAFLDVNPAYCEMTGFSREELIRTSCLKQTIEADHLRSKEALTEVYEKGFITDFVKTCIRKDGSLMVVNMSVSLMEDKKRLLVSSKDITQQIAMQEQIKAQKEFVQTLLDSQEQLIITTDGKVLNSVNYSFLAFFDVPSIQEFKCQYRVNCICELFSTDAPQEYLRVEMEGLKWIDYVIEHPHRTHKAMIVLEGKKCIFSVTATQLPSDDGHLMMSAVFTDITELEEAKQSIEVIHKHTQSSIEYASLIQHAIIPPDHLFGKYFKDFFTIWQPKEIVGGDIYLFEELRHDEECLIMLIDCTGHGVSGAFVTMLVKAIEGQIGTMIASDRDMEVSPAWVLAYANQLMKKLLKQEDNNSISNAGFDGAVLYYNKQQSIIKFAGARTPLYYLDAEKQYHQIKGSRHSAGYKRSDINYAFQEHTIPITEGMKFYLTTDGYLDQNGGEKGLPFGKQRFQELIEGIEHQPFVQQQKRLIETIVEYQGERERNDDITVIGFEI